MPQAPIADDEDEAPAAPTPEVEAEEPEQPSPAPSRDLVQERRNRHIDAYAQADEAIAAEAQSQRPFAPMGRQKIDAYQQARVRDEFVQEADREAALEEQSKRLAAAEEKAKRDAETKAYNSKALNTMLATGQRHFIDPATGRVSPILDPETKKPLFSTTAWEETLHPETSEPAFGRRTKTGETEYRRPPMVSAPDPDDDNLYFNMGNGDLRPAGPISKFLKDPDFAVQRTAIRAQAAQRTARWKQAIAPMEEVAGEATARFDTAAIQRDELTTQAAGLQQQLDALSVDPTLSQTQGGLLGVGAQPTDAAVQMSSNIASLQAQLDQVNSQRLAIEESLKPGGELARLKRAATLNLAVFKAKASHDAYSDLADERRAILKAQGLPEKDDPTLKSIMAAQKVYDDSLTKYGSQVEKESAANPAPAEAAPAGEPIDRFKQGQKKIGNVDIEEFARRYGAGDGEVRPATLIKIQQRGREIDEMLANKKTALGASTRKGLEEERTALQQIFDQRFAKLDVETQRKIKKVVDFQNTTVGGAVARELGENVGPLAGAWAVGQAGIVAGAALPVIGETGIGEVVGGLVGTIAGGILGHKAQANALKAVAPEIYEDLQRLRAVDAEQHPIAQSATGFLANAAIAKIDPGAAARGVVALSKIAAGKAATAAELGAAKALAVQSGLATATSVAIPLIEGEKVEPGQMAASVASMLLLGSLRGQVSAKGVIAHIDEAFPRAFWEVSGMDSKTFAKEYPPAVRRVGANQGTPEDIALVQRVNAAAKTAGVKVGDLARGRMVAELLDYKAKPIQKIIPEHLRPEREGGAKFTRVGPEAGPEPGKRGAPKPTEPPEGGPDAADQSFGKFTDEPGGERKALTEAAKQNKADDVAEASRAAADVTPVDIGPRDETVSTGTGKATPKEEAMVTDWKKKIAAEQAEAPAGSTAVQEGSTLRNGKSDSDKNQLSAGPQAKQGVDREAAENNAPAVEKRNTEAADAWLTAVARNDSEAAGHAEEKLLGSDVGSEKLRKLKVSIGINPDGPAIRTPGGYGIDTRKAAITERARASQERQRLGQSAGQSGASVGVGTREGALGESDTGGKGEKTGGGGKVDVGAGTTTTPAGEGLAPATKHGEIEGEKINRAWTAFAPEAKGLGIPRAEMPQVHAEHRGALVNFLKGQGIASKEAIVRPTDLKPSQVEYSSAKVEKARKFEGGDRAILVSSDNHVIDGHHQWVAKLHDSPSQPMRVIRIDAPARDLIAKVKEFPSAETAAGATKVDTTAKPAETPANERAADSSPDQTPPKQNAGGDRAPDAGGAAVRSEGARDELAPAGERGNEPGQPGVAGRGDGGTATPGRGGESLERTERQPAEGAPAGGGPGEPDDVGRREPAVRKPKPEITEADRNHRIAEGDTIAPAGDKTKAKANIAALTLLKKLEAETRNPTPEEKRILAQYVGWGGLPNVFNDAMLYARQQAKAERYMGDEQRQELANWEKEWGKLFDEIKGGLTKEERDAASRSTINAHYTSREVIAPMWDIVRQLGFRGGTALETSMGIGHFLGLEPGDLAARTRWKGVELDDISARISQKLYPEAQIQATGFQDAKIPDHSVDLVIGNVPFAKDGPIDARYPRLSLHNYFFARSLDALKPGGLLVAITSNSTMDSPGSRAAREYLAERADLVGAIRLPNTAFKKNAGTEVTTDIVILRKRGGGAFSGEPWLNTQDIPTYDGTGVVPVNEYFARHPEMMLGRMSLEGTMYRGDEAALLPNPGADLGTEIRAAAAKLPADIIGQREAKAPEAAGAAGEQAAGKEGSIIVREGKPYVIESGTLKDAPWAAAKNKTAVSYAGLRDTLKSLLTLMQSDGASDGAIKAAREELNRLYEGHVKRYGRLNDRSHNFLEEDPELPLVRALEDVKVVPKEHIIQSGKNAGQKRAVFEKQYEKAGIFTKRTIFPRQEPTSADTTTDAISQSMAYRNEIDPTYIAELRDVSEEQARKQLDAEPNVFVDPKTGKYETGDQYLSGFVREKLVQAERAAKSDPAYKKNVEALKKNQPPWLDMQEISFRLGSSWLPPKIVDGFLKDKLGVGARVDFIPQTAHWILEPTSGWSGALNTTTFGTTRLAGHELVDYALNLKSPVVYDRVSTPDGEKSIKNQQETLIAQQKLQEIQNEFREYVRKKGEAHAELEKIYNEQFNGVTLRDFKGPTWDHYPDASHDVKLRQHQKDVVSRILQESTLLAHSVGTGKTYIMATAAMEMRRLGLAKKPMIVTQNATTQQFAASFKKLYPTAKILVPTKKQRESGNRQRLMSKIATGDYDSVIIPQSFLNQLPDDQERVASFIQAEIDELKSAKIEAAYGARAKSPKVKDLEKALKRLEEKLEALSDRKQDNTVTFEQLGVDALFVDEAHAYKKLEFTTQMDNIKGLDRGASERGLGLYMKTRWIQDRNNGKNVVLATGTPISNTIAEAWNMLRFTRPDLLKKYGVEKFDKFASTFGDTVTNIEQTAGGGFKSVTRFAKYANGPELIAMFHSGADVVLKEDINLPDLPAVRNGQPTNIEIEQTPNVGKFIKVLRDRLARFDRMTGAEKRANSHIPLVVFGEAKKATLDLRLLDANMPDEPGSKINRAADEIAKIYRDSADVKGTQLVFADLFQSPDGLFNLYAEIKRKLVERGVPPGEIANVNEVKNDAQRERMFDAVKNGDIRVLLGSTEKMGVGVNVQDKLIALHHLDAPARPMDIEQRNGRIVRQGNSNPVVDLLNYGVKNTLDATLYQRLAIKQKFINQIMRGDVQGRSFEDAADEVSMTFEEQMAAFSGNPLAMKKVAIEGEARRLEAMKSGYIRQMAQTKAKLAEAKDYLVDREAYLPKLEASAAEMAKEVGGPVTGVVEGKRYDEKDALAEAIDAKLKGFQAEQIKAIGQKIESRGWKFEAGKIDLFGIPVHLWLHVPTNEYGMVSTGARDPYFVYDAKLKNGVIMSGEVSSGSGLLTSFTYQAKALENKVAEAKGTIARLNRDIAEMSGFITQPFAHDEALKAAKAETAAIDKALEEATKAEEAKATAEAQAGPDVVIDALKDLKIHKPGDLAAGSPISLAWDAAIDVAIIAVKTGRKLQQAIAIAVGRFRERYPGATKDQVARLQRAMADSVARLTETRAAGAAFGKGVVEAATKNPPWTPTVEALAGFEGRAQRGNDYIIKHIVEPLKEAVPSRDAREAMTAWIQADGDPVILRAWRDGSKADPKTEKYAARYQRALDLSPTEIKWANEVKRHYAEKLRQGQREGFLGEGIENYVNQWWDLDTKGSKYASEHGPQVTQFFRSAQQRKFPSSYEGEQAGMRPKTYDLAELVGMYTDGFNRISNTRKLIKELTTKKAADGRPLAAPIGTWETVAGEGEDGSTIFVKPGSKAEDYRDYRLIDHPAMNKWKWAGEEGGKPVMMKGSLAIHPDAYADVKNAIGKSGLVNWYNSEGSAMAQIPKWIAKKIDRINSTVKATSLGFLSPFHQVQEGTHAIGHRINPFYGLPKIDLENPRQAYAVMHGLMLAPGSRQMADFMDGFTASDNPLHNIPLMGEQAKNYSTWLFHQYIPSLKMKTWEAMMERNEKLYGGKISKDEIAYLSAIQANNAYGHLNYVAMGRNPTIQHILRLVLLAPDFLEARGRFAAEAAQGTFSKAGREQTIALAFLAMTFWLAARVGNSLLNDGDPKMDHPFTVVHGNREYIMRSVPEDIYRMFKDTRMFIMGRLSPIARTLFEGVTGRNARGEKIDFDESVVDLAARSIPASVQWAPGLNDLSEYGKANTLAAWEQAMAPMGLQIKRSSPQFDAYRMAEKYQKDIGEKEDRGSYPVSQYQKLRYALEDGKGDIAKAEAEKLIQAELESAARIKRKMTRDEAVRKIARGFEASVFNAWTKNLEMDKAFRASLTPEDRRKVLIADKQRDQLWIRFTSLMGLPDLAQRARK